jgi:hypothetical protein
LLETFTAIGFGIMDLENSLDFAKYVTPLFEFMKSLSDEKYNLNTELIKSILEFIADLINLYGSDIKALVNQDFVKINIKKLQMSVRTKKIEACLKRLSEVIDSYLINILL